MKGWNHDQTPGPRLKKRQPAAPQEGEASGSVSLWLSCPSCGHMLFKPHLPKSLYVCTQCQHHFALSAQQRLGSLLDKVEATIGEDCQAQDWVRFKDSLPYTERLQKAQKKTRSSEALSVQVGKIGQQRAVVAAFDFGFIGGSMGTAVGERFVQAVHYAIKQRYPLVCVASSGGARMQESLYSLMQMSKTSAALARLSQAGLCYIVVLASPCMGGVSASLGMLGDLLIAEPGAMIGFTGRRVIEQTVRGQLPEGFQESEFLLEHGAIDMIVDRRELKEVIGRLLRRLSQGTCDAGLE